tara:strand:+ start:255 stop:437 length:183 start_codon:yes stop_codon:yes gene_type:complete
MVIHLKTIDVLYVMLQKQMWQGRAINVMVLGFVITIMYLMCLEVGFVTNVIGALVALMII